MGKLKKIVKENLDEFISYVFENKLNVEDDLSVIKDFVANKTTPYSLLQRWSKLYAGEFKTKKASQNSVISDFADKIEKTKQPANA
jgi:hypothetical protein